MSLTHITVRGAREHNLKGFDVSLPREQLIVITGLSGSGKSSLAFDTIYAEGQRRYVESLSAYARQFLEMMQKPDVEHIDGLSPAISIEQKTTSRNPRPSPPSQKFTTTCGCCGRAWAFPIRLPPVCRSPHRRSA
jgi:excinuclease ABC subunit A